MKRIMVILFLFTTSFVRAQTLSKNKVDLLTGDTAQFSRSWALHKPLSWLLDHSGAIIGWRVEKTRDIVLLICKSMIPVIILLYQQIAAGWKWRFQQARHCV